jgi:peptide subunit release factor 1 (eRF1)
MDHNLITRTAACEANLSTRTTEKHAHNEIKGKIASIDVADANESNGADISSGRKRKEDMKRKNISPQAKVRRKARIAGAGTWKNERKGKWQHLWWQFT